jgi:16S rRNA (cytidine1402-2'-O)-methyltransferase
MSARHAAGDPSRSGAADEGGALVLVATPIGNLGDLSARAIEALTIADVVACEDTRRTRVLLTHFGIAAGGRLRAVPAHDEDARVDAIVALVGGGARVAFVTDAGMPAISDPGAAVVRACVAAGLAVEVVPGPDAATTALVLSGLPTDRFVFEGFLPRKGRARTERIAAIAAESRTVVLYESPRRVSATLRDLEAACGPDRPAALARELTQLHEEVRRGSIGSLLAALGDTDPRGECVLVVGGATDSGVPVTDAEIDAALAEQLAAGASTKDAADAVAARFRVPRRAAYARAVTLKPR